MLLLYVTLTELYGRPGLIHVADIYWTNQQVLLFLLECRKCGFDRILRKTIGYFEKRVRGDASSVRVASQAVQFSECSMQTGQLQ